MGTAAAGDSAEQKALSVRCHWLAAAGGEEEETGAMLLGRLVQEEVVGYQQNVLRTWEEGWEAGWENGLRSGRGAMGLQRGGQLKE